MTLAEKARAHLTECGSSAGFLHIFSVSGKTAAIPQTQTPYIYFVLDGELRLYTPGGIMDYAPGQYCISAIDTPERGYVLALSGHGDLLSASVDFAASDALSLIMSMDDALTARILADDQDEELSARHDRLVLSCLERMVDALDDPPAAEPLCRQIRAELLLHILCGSCGKSFIQSLTGLRDAGEIYEANSWLKRNYRQSFRVEELAEQRNMSVSQFHQKFKSAVGIGPLQCQKRLRLTEARRLMLDEGKNATEAALDVGYESLSQFTREYRKMFGSSPSADISHLQKK